MKELGVAYLSIRFALGDDRFHYCIRPLGRRAGVSVVSQRLLTDGSRRQELLQGILMVAPPTIMPGVKECGRSDRR